MKQFKIRCSAIGQIMGKLSGGITEIQQKKLDTLQAKEKRTVKQQEEMEALVIKQDAPKALPKTCISYLEQWVKENVYEYRTEIKSKYIDKGNMCEDEAIAMAIKQFNLTYNEKNEMYFENEYLTGTPDLIYMDEIFDTKCSYSPDTFPVFETDHIKSYNYDYWAQGQGYMELVSVNSYSVVYALCNTPQELIERELFHALKGLDATAREKKEAEVMRNHNFDNIPLSLKLKRFKMVRDPDYINAVYERVKMCREYIDSVLLPMVQK